MRTFYDVPNSLVVEYIYNHECVKLQDLANLLHLNSEQIHSFIPQFKHDKFIVIQRRSELNLDLINIQSIIENFE